MAITCSNLPATCIFYKHLAGGDNCVPVHLHMTSCGSGGSCVKSDELPHLMSFESASVGTEDKFKT